MQPSEFPEQNHILTAPEGLEGEVSSLTCWKGGVEIASLWRPSLRERLSILIFGRVWLRIMGVRHPPVSVEGRRTIFMPVKVDSATVTA